MKSIILCDNGHPESVLPLCVKYGFGIEIQGFCNPNETEKASDLASHYQGLLPKGLQTYLHAPMWDLCLGSANKKIVEVTRFYFDYAYAIAERFNCAGITVHHGFVPHTSYPANWIKRSTVFWQDFFAAHPDNITMYMENVCEQNTETLIGIIDACQNKRLAVNLDIGHAHCNTDLPVVDWITQLGDRIGYVHIHQNHGSHDEHLGLKQGNLPMKVALEALLRYAPNAIWSLECNTDEMEESISVLDKWGYIPNSVK